MVWIVSAGDDIVVDINQLQARHEYIELVTTSNVTKWQWMKINGQASREFLYCISDDKLHGTFITAHITQVYRICKMREILNGELVVANTCVWERFSNKNLLFAMMQYNRQIELWFAKQELSMDNAHIFRQSTTLKNVGEFGFQSSLSERALFRNRNLGLKEAIQKSFDKVPPLLLLSD